MYSVLKGILLVMLERASKVTIHKRGLRRQRKSRRRIRQRRWMREWNGGLASFFPVRRIVATNRTGGGKSWFLFNGMSSACTQACHGTKKMRDHNKISACLRQPPCETREPSAGSTIVWPYYPYCHCYKVQSRMAIVLHQLHPHLYFQPYYHE